MNRNLKAIFSKVKHRRDCLERVQPLCVTQGSRLDRDYTVKVLILVILLLMKAIIVCISDEKIAPDLALGKYKFHI